MHYFEHNGRSIEKLLLVLREQFPEATQLELQAAVRAAATEWSEKYAQRR